MWRSTRVHIGPFICYIYFILKNSLIIKFADDTVLNVAGNDIETIKSHVPDDLNLLAEWFKEIELILNLKKGKTEAMIFGTAKRLAMLYRGLKVKYQHHNVKITTSYRYLGVDIGPTLTSNKNATDRLHLLNKLRFQLDTKAAVTINKSLIIPVLTYSSV